MHIYNISIHILTLKWWSSQESESKYSNSSCCEDTRTYVTCYVIWSLLLYNMLSTMHATVQDYSPLPFIAYFWVHLDCFFMSPLVCRLSSVKGMYGSGVYFAQKARVPRSLHREVKVVQNCSHQQVPPLELFGSFFFPANEFVKILTDELEEWHHGWTGLFFSLRLAKRINTRDSAPILRSFPPGWVFGRKKASSQQLWVHSQPVIHFPWNQHSTLK